MNKDRHVILGIHVTDRVHHSGEVQNALSEFGCQIKTRIGLHEASKDFCSTSGVILLEMLDEQARIDGLLSRLKSVEGVEVQSMIFGHD